MSVGHRSRAAGRFGSRLFAGPLPLVAAVLFGLSAAGCTPSGAPASTPTPQAPKPAANKPAEGKSVASKQWSAPPTMQLDQSKTYSATITTTLGQMKAELYAKEAPSTTNNFVFLAREGFYNGVTFHRIIRDFMVQTGDPTGTGTGGPGYRFADELSTPFGYERGTLAMANAGPNTQGSQFFIVHGDQGARLPKNYTIFGKLTAGLEVLDKIAGVPVERGPSGENSKPTDPPRIENITITEQ